MMTLLNNAKSNEIEVRYISNSLVNRKRLSLLGDHRDIYGMVIGKFTINTDYIKQINDKLNEHNSAEIYKANPRAYGEWLNKNTIGYCGKALLQTTYKIKDISTRFYTMDKDNDVAEVPLMYMNSHQLINHFQSMSRRQMKMGIPEEECILTRPIRLDSIMRIKIDGVNYRLTSLREAIRNDERRTDEKKKLNGNIF